MQEDVGVANRLLENIILKFKGKSIETELRNLLDLQNLLFATFQKLKANQELLETIEVIRQYRDEYVVNLELVKDTEYKSFVTVMQGVKMYAVIGKY